MNQIPDDGMFGKVIQFLQTTPLPGSIVSKSGEIIFLNQEMIDLKDNEKNNPVFKCSWLSDKDEGTCPDCAETPVLEGRCFVSRESSDVTLLTAVRVKQAQNALVRLYTSDTSLSQAETEIHTNRLLQIAAPEVTNDETFAPTRFDNQWLSSAYLWEIAENVIESNNVKSMKIENRVVKNLNLEATNPMLIGRIISKVLFELDTIKSHSAITIKSLAPEMEKSASNDHTIIFTLKNPKAYKKGNASQLKAIELRLRLFCKRLVQATGYQFEEPSLFQYDSFIEVRILIPDVLKNIDDLISGSPDGPSPALSFREQEIVDMVRNGYDNIDISSNLNITHATVKQHLKAIYRKLKINSRIDLIFR